MDVDGPVLSQADHIEKIRIDYSALKKSHLNVLCF